MKFIILMLGCVVFLIGCTDPNMSDNESYGAYPSKNNDYNIVSSHSIHAETLDLSEDLERLKEITNKGQGFIKEQNYSSDSKVTTVDISIPKDEAPHIIDVVYNIFHITEETFLAQDLSSKINKYETKLKQLEEAVDKIYELESNDESLSFSDKRALREELFELKEEVANTTLELSEIESKLKNSIVRLTLTEVELFSSERSSLRGALTIFFLKGKAGFINLLVKIIDNLYLILFGAFIFISYRKLGTSNEVEENKKKD